MAVFRFMYRPQDFEGAVAFYGDTLGLGIVDQWDDDGRGIIFQAPGAQVELFGTGSDGSDSTPRPHRPASPDGSLAAGLAWQIDDADAEHDRLVGLGVPVVAEPENQPWGMRNFTVTGPDGVLITLFQMLD